MPLNDSLEFDDELSNHFLRKDMTKFWRHWYTRFSKRNARPTNVNGYYKNEDIAEYSVASSLQTVLILTLIIHV